MSDKTGIAWTDATLNAIRGCTPVSAGCDHCYAASVAYRFNGEGMPYEGLADMGSSGLPEFNGKVTLVPEKLLDPLRWQKPRRIFVNSMSDLFHASVPLRFVDRHFAVFALAQRHQFQILTKRPLRMQRYLNDPKTPERVWQQAQLGFNANKKGIELIYPMPWPLPNVWVGTSVESQDVVSRVEHLVGCQAAVRFLSCEPLLGPLDIHEYLHPETYGITSGVDWVIVGGESGRGFRPMETAWARSLRDQCVVANIPFFFKQSAALKSGTGDTLDGLEWKQFPAPEPAHLVLR